MNMAKRIVVAVVLMPALLWIMLVPPPLAWTVLVCAISAMAAFELLRAVGEGRITAPMRAAAIVSAALLPFFCWVSTGAMFFCFSVRSSLESDTSAFICSTETKTGKVDSLPS